MQDIVHLRRRFGGSKMLPKRRCSLALAIEAAAMASSKRGHFIEEEELRPARPTIAAISPHHLPPPATKCANANDPGLGGPPPFEQRPGIGIMDDATVAREHAARFGDADLAEGIDAVLQRHVSHAPRKCVAAARQSQSKFCARCSTTCIFLRTLYPAPCLNVPG